MINIIEETKEIEQDKDLIKSPIEECKAVICEEDHIKMAREFVLDVSSYTMANPEKRMKFAKDLKDNKTMNDYVNNQALFKLFKSNNEHVRAGIVYSYLYIKNLNCVSYI